MMKSVYYHDKILVIYSSMKELNLRSLVGWRYIDHLVLSYLQGLTKKKVALCWLRISSLIPLQGEFHRDR